MQLDTVRSRATPEGVTLSLRIAGAPVRAVAWFLDTMLIWLTVFLLQILLGYLGGFGAGLFMLLVFVIHWFYPVAFEVLNDGVTPGKKAMGLRVIHDDGTPVAATASLLRNFLRPADFLPAAYGAGLVSLLLTADSQRLGDLAAGTVVVYRDDGHSFGDLAAGEVWAPPVALSRREQRAIVDFASRLTTWSDERAEELADLAQPLTRSRGAESVSRLVGMAHYVTGRRSEPA